MQNFISPRFLERKLGKELPAKLRFASGKENGGIGVWVCAESGPVTVIVKVIVKVNVNVSVIVTSACRGPARRQGEENFFGEEFRPAGRVPFWVTRKAPKSDWGSPSMSTWLAPVLIGVAPQTPFYGGRPPERLVMTSRRAKCSSVIPFASGLRPYVCKI